MVVATGVVETTVVDSSSVVEGGAVLEGVTVVVTRVVVFCVVEGVTVEDNQPQETYHHRLSDNIFYVKDGRSLF